MKGIRRVLQRAHHRLFPLPMWWGWELVIKTAQKRTDELALVVYVSRKEKYRDLAPKEIIPRSIDKVPTDVVEIGEVRLLKDRRSKMRPAQPGCSIGHGNITAGTFGALVKDNKTQELLILSNNHVLANATDGEDGRAKLGDMILQPGPYDGGSRDDAIGVLHRFVPINTELQVPECAVAKLAERVENRILSLLRPDYQVQFLKTEPRAIWWIAPWPNPFPPGQPGNNGDRQNTGRHNGAGDEGAKEGRTTGLTREVKPSLPACGCSGLGTYALWSIRR